MNPETHATREECVAEGAFVDEVHSVRVRCPVCGREFEHVYDLVGLWNPDEAEYVQDA